MDKILHGDCLELMKSINDKSIDMILCDLPYGTTACKWDIIIPFEPLWKEYKRIIKDNGAIVLFGSEPFSSYLRMSNIKDYKYDWIWDKRQTGNPFLAKKQPLKVYENILVFNTKIYHPQMIEGKMRKKGGGKHSKVFGNTDEVTNNQYYPKSILEISNCSNKSEKLHPTQKPVALFEYLIKTYTNEKDTVLDNCAGSGTTAIACINTNRNYILMEKEQKYYDVIIDRINKHKEQTKLSFT